MSKLEKFLKESNLSEEAKNLILEAWDEEKRNVASEMREEMKARYVEDHSNLVEGLNNLVTNVIKENMTSVHDEKQKLVEDRQKIRSSLGNFSAFANGVLAEEVKKMRTERKNINEAMKGYVDFSNKILSEEIKEFHGERNKLVEQRVKLIAEGKKRIDEAKANFVKRASESASNFLESQNRSLMNEYKQNILEAQQNNFGRMIFEAFQSEFLVSQFNENAVLNKMKASLNESNSKNLELTAQLNESVKVANEAKKQIRIMEDKHARDVIITDLTKSLTPNQKQIMENLLLTTPTEKLNEDFKKYQKAVLNGSTNGVNSRKSVNESVNTDSLKVHTGNRNAIVESLSSDDQDLLDMISKRAGIRGK